MYKEKFMLCSNSELLKYAVAQSQLNSYDIQVLAQQASKYYRSKGAEEFRELQELEKRWYDSLSNNDPDYDVYLAPEFVAESWACFCVYSKGYIRSVSKLDIDFSNINNVLDLGCGIGLTTAYLKSLFVNAKVVGTNLKSFQFDIATEMGKDLDFTIQENIQGIENTDVVFASEYFEHFYEPVEHLKEILVLKPKFIITANAFSSYSVGHFPEYLIDGKLIENKKVGRIFNKYVREHGYKKVETGFYNNRPYVWKKI